MSSAASLYQPSAHSSDPSEHLWHGQHIQQQQWLTSTRTSNIHVAGENTWFRGGLPTPPRTRDMVGVMVSGNRGPSGTAYQPASMYDGRHRTTTGHSRGPSDPYPNGASRSRHPEDHSVHRTDTDTAQFIASHLQIPESVNKSKGSLAEFAAEITCLFWFETATTLQYAETLPLGQPTDRGLGMDAKPSPGFRKWVTTILSTTQVGKNVILLALMFIYRLKKFNPAVSGKRGSEFRLLTIALMLGNKFLDDNTYTNKTWAEVSGISVTEIHMMEVEFLSNMRYELYASLEEWDRWKALLGKFGVFYNKAARFEAAGSITTQPATPTAATFTYKLPSPPSHQHSLPAANYNVLPNPFTSLPPLPQSPTRPRIVDHHGERKRSLDPSEHLPPSKRPHLSLNSNFVSMSTPQAPSSVGSMGEHIFSPSIGMTASTVPNGRMVQLPAPRASTSATMGNQLAPLHLPSTRAMASVYAGAPAWNPPVTPISVPSPVVAGGANGPNSHYTSYTGDGRGYTMSSARTSPTHRYGPATPTRPALSPSHLLMDRSSPYRPVRNVNTLLIPPPATALQNAPRHIDFSQMHYQPLGRPTDIQTGHVPYFVPDGRTQSALSTPIANQYRTF